MRLSEKTIELNFCAQAQLAHRGEVFWFGLTQRQEAIAGFDVATRLGGRVVILQFKASNLVLRSGERRFSLGHTQLEALVRQARPARMRSVFYVFPDLGDTGDLRGGRMEILRRSWLLDLASLPAVPAPRRSDGLPRRNETHYADLRPPTVTIHSDPIETSVIRADEFFREQGLGSDGIDISRLREVIGRQSSRIEDRRPFGSAAIAVVLA